MENNNNNNNNNNNDDRKNIDLYYLNRGIWLSDKVELNSLMPFLLVFVFQNLFSIILSFLLFFVISFLNKQGFTIKQSLRVIGFFFKKSILPIDDYDYTFFKRRHLIKDERFIKKEIYENKVILNKNKKEKLKKLR